MSVSCSGRRSGRWGACLHRAGVSGAGRVPPISATRFATVRPSRSRSWAGAYGRAYDRLVPRDEVRVGGCEPRQELLPHARPEVEQDRRHVRRARVERRRHDLSQLPRIVGDARQDRRHEDAARHARLVQRANRLDPLARMRCPRLGAAPRVLVERADRERGRDVGDLRGLHEELEVSQDERALREDRERVPVVGEGFDDPRHEPIPALDALVGIGVRSHRDALALPAFGRELTPEHLRRVHLHDDLRLEVATGVHVEEGVCRTGEAVVAHDAVRDEVAGPGGDVEHRHVETERFDPDNAEWGVALEREAVEGPLPSDGGIHGVEESQALSESSQKPNVAKTVLSVQVLDHIGELERIETFRHSRDDLIVGVRDPDHIPGARSLRVEDAGQEPLPP